MSLPVNVDLDCFQLLAIMNKDSLNICLKYVSVKTMYYLFIWLLWVFDTMQRFL